MVPKQNLEGVQTIHMIISGPGLSALHDVIGKLFYIFKRLPFELIPAPCYLHDKTFNPNIVKGLAEIYGQS